MIHIEDKMVVNYASWQDFLKELKSKNGSYQVTFKPRKYRTNSQNAYYWAIMVPMIKDGLRDAGYDEIKTNNDAHDVLKALFHKKEIINKITGELITTIPGSTVDMSTSEFKQYMEDIAKWAAQNLSINIPPPGMQMSFH